MAKVNLRPSVTQFDNEKEKTNLTLGNSGTVGLVGFVFGVYIRPPSGSMTKFAEVFLAES